MSESQGSLKGNAGAARSSLSQTETGSKVQSLERVRAGENVAPGCAIPGLGHQGGHGWGRGDNVRTSKACRTGEVPREDLSNRDSSEHNLN